MASLFLNFKMPISQSVFKLQRDLKAQNVAELSAYKRIAIIFQCHFRFKSFLRSDPEVGKKFPINFVNFKDSLNLITNSRSTPKMH